MTSRLDLLNDILDALGEPALVTDTITSSSSDWAKRANRALDRAEKIVAERHDWNFFKTVEQLAGTGNDDPVGWEYEFNLPSNVRRIQKVSIDGGYNTRPLSYETRQGVILTNSETSFLHYVNEALIAAYGSWPEVYARAVSQEGAWLASRGTTKSQSIKDEVDAGRKVALSDAKTWDGQQQPTKPRYEGSFVRAVTNGWRSRENG